jgi:serine/threonine-protein kinase RsbW
MAHDRYYKKYPASVDNLPAIRNFVKEKGIALHADSELLQDFVLAVNEIITNIIVHGYECKPGEIRLEVRQKQSSLIVQVSDDAPCFNPTLLTPPDISLPLDIRPMGKMGVYLSRKLLDEVTYQPLPKIGNQLTLIKHNIILKHERGSNDNQRKSNLG